MRRNTYIAAFVAIILLACIGGFVGGRVLLARLQSDFNPRTPPAATATAVAQVAPAGATTPLPAGPTATAAATQPRATSTVMVVPAPVTDQPAIFTPAPTWTAGVELPTSVGAPTSAVVLLPGMTPPTNELGTPEPFPSEPLPSEPLPSATPVGNYPFSLARAVRYSNGDCPGTYAQGVVVDGNGDPLPGVRLRLVDEYGNAATTVTKPGPGDAGRYDFPMSGPARRFFMSVVDAADRPQSPEVLILHDLAPQEGQNCRWVDWQQK